MEKKAMRFKVVIKMLTICPGSISNKFGYFDAEEVPKRKCV